MLHSTPLKILNLVWIVTKFQLAFQFWIQLVRFSDFVFLFTNEKYLFCLFLAYVLDEEKMPVPLGEIGQLYVSSTNLCDGYVGKNKSNFSRNKVGRLLLDVFVEYQIFFFSTVGQLIFPNMIFHMFPRKYLDLWHVKWS